MDSLSKFLRIGLLFSLLGSAVIAVPLKIYDSNGKERVERLRTELDALQEGNADLKRENEELAREIHAFHSDPHYVEKVARDELGMVGKEEVIYQFPSRDH